ncbi:MAG: glycosyltransferase family 4 protein [Hyphomicrobiaceae bacterium]
MTRAAFLIPGDLHLPTGGYAYDRRVLALFAAMGLDVEHVELPAAYPAPTVSDLSKTAQIVAGLPDDAALLIDGLAYGAMPEHLIRQFKRPIIALCHHPLALEAGLSPSRSAELKASETMALALARAVIVTSPATRDLLVADFGVGANRVAVAIPGTDPAPRSHGTGNPLQLLAVGSVVPRKGYDVLMRALSRLKGLDWHLDIAGADDRAPQAATVLRDLISTTGLSGRVTLNGAVSDERLSQLYASADIFVMSSLFEGYGMVLAEAMARGLPIVCTTGGAAAETAPADAALKVPPGDDVALADALQTMMSNPDRRAKMAEASWRSGLALPRWEETAHVIADVIRKATA